MELKAYAKINLGLDVLGTRPDGYHELRMIMQTVGICDRIVLEKSDCEGIRFSLENPPVRASGGDAGSVPEGSDNLAVRAAKLLLEEFDIPSGLNIKLWKCIPVAAGMAGGSTDAAGVLCGVNELFRIGLSEKDLMERAVRLGADVPYCILGGTALAEGIGEKLTALPELEDLPLVIAKPDAAVSTKFVYDHLVIDERTCHPDIDGMTEAVRRGDVSGIISRLGNVLETSAVPAFPVIGELKEQMRSAGARGVLMSGSGPTVFGICESRAAAETVAENVRRSGLAAEVYCTGTVSREMTAAGRRVA